MALVGVGVVVGLVVAAMLTTAFERLLFDVGPRDPLTFIAVAITVLAVAFVASYVPASRAARIEPQLALKSD